MKQVIIIIFILVSLNICGQDNNNKNILFIGIEGYYGLNDINDFAKLTMFKTINIDNIYLLNGVGIKLYDFIYTDLFPKNKHPFKINTGITIFNVGKGNVFSIPLNLKTDIRLIRDIGLSFNIGGRYFTNANNDFNNKIFLEYGFEFRFRIHTSTFLGIGWSIIQKSNSLHSELPIYPLN